MTSLDNTNSNDNNCCEFHINKALDEHKVANIVDKKLNNNIDLENIENNTHHLKYKMGVYLLNSKDHGLNFKRLFKRYWNKVIFIFIASLLFNAGIQIFLKRAETIPSGVTGIPTLIQYAVPAVEPYFALLYLAFNIPLFLIFGWRIKKSFIFLTLTFMLFQILTNLFFTAPVISVGLQEFITFTERNEPTSNWSNIVYSFIGALFIALGISISWRSGGSTGGTDIIAYYFSVKSKKNVGHVLSIIGVATAITFLIIFAFLKPNYLYPNPLDNEGRIITNIANMPVYKDNAFINGSWDINKLKEIFNNKNSVNGSGPHRIYFGIRELTTFLYILIVNVFIDILYPKYKKVDVTIISCNPEKVLAYFRLINYWHSYRIESYKSGYTGKQATKISTVMLILETPNIISDLKLIDPNIWISISRVKQVVGNFNTEFVEH
ncbi:YitT family protein [Mycoplasma sp. 6243]|uniref:YitT family protein n=1 Tax=Mycoplasma sp. 6243 TaxID=3440865 RepID=UPI003EBD67B0